MYDIPNIILETPEKRLILNRVKQYQRFQGLNCISYNVIPYILRTRKSLLTYACI